MAEYQGCELPEDLYYDLDYVWARPRADGTYLIGVTDPAQTMAGRVQYATFKKTGTHREAGKPIVRLESGKWAGGVPAPFAGEIVEINARVASDPGFINVAPYDDAWLVVMRPDNPQEAQVRLHRGPDALKALEAWIDRYGVQCMRCTT